MGMYRVRTGFLGVQGSPWLNTLYFDDGGGTAQQAATAAGAFWEACDNMMKTDVAWATEADVALIDEATGQTTGITTTTPVTGVGDDSGNILPFATQGLARLRTGVFYNGREVRGRIFIPGTTETYQNSGRPDAAFTGTVDAAITALVGSANAQLVVWSRTQQLSAVVSGGSCWSQFAVLRSRRD